MLQPRKQKYRKAFRGRMKGKAISGSVLSFGEYGLKALGRGWLTARQIEAARKAITHHTKRTGKMWIRVFPDKPVTAKESGQGMGSGKGDVKQYVVPIVPGKILFELSGVTPEIAREAMRLAGHKLPFKSKFMSREDQRSSTSASPESREGQK
jgi:large subunit ribosomal protein L16